MLNKSKYDFIFYPEKSACNIIVCFVPGTSKLKIWEIYKQTLNKRD